jgi:hypothetical protein
VPGQREEETLKRLCMPRGSGSFRWGHEEEKGADDLIL